MLQTIFGLFTILDFLDASVPKKRVELRPVDARMSLPAGHASYLFEEFAQYFCVDEAFGTGPETIQRVLRQSVPVETLERINRRVGSQAAEFLDELPIPAGNGEGELLVFSDDGKGVPPVQSEAKKVPLFEPRRTLWKQSHGDRGPGVNRPFATETHGHSASPNHHISEWPNRLRISGTLPDRN